MSRRELEEMADRRSTTEAYRELNKDTRDMIRENYRHKPMGEKYSAIWEAWFWQKDWERTRD